MAHILPVSAAAGRRVSSAERRGKFRETGAKELTGSTAEKQTGPEVERALRERFGRLYNPPGLPTYVIVDHEGIIRGTR
jgi:hypothetical protein